MLNKNNERELAYFARVTDIKPMDAERLEAVYINGWVCVCGKGSFHVGDLGVFFEPDSKLPDKKPFNEIEFLVKKDFKIKPQKIRGVVSSGLFMPLSDFSWVVDEADGTIVVPPEERMGETKVFNDTDFLTEFLGVTYAVFEDNSRKAPIVDKYKRMAQRNPKLGKTFWWKWLYRRTWGKKVLFAFFGKKRDKKSGWPAWVIKTDEERIQNQPWRFTEENRKKKWIATEKVDGTSTTFTMRGFGRKRQFLVCSRNVVFDKPDKKCFYETNVYTEMAEKYDIENVLAKTLDFAKKNIWSDIEFITIQAETFGAGVQKRDYGMTDHDMRVFNIIYGYKDGHTVRLNPIDGKKVAENAGLKYVPIISEEFYLPETCDELLQIATGTSQIDGGMREGIVFRSEDGADSFKAVSNEFLLKYHG